MAELPIGLCAQRGDHLEHEHDSVTLGKFHCTGVEFDRQPGKSERLRRERHGDATTDAGRI